MNWKERYAMVDSLVDVLVRRPDESGNLAPVVALLSLAMIALVPLIGPGVKADMHALGQAIPALAALVGFH
jgi:hypothetical protein